MAAASWAAITGTENDALDERPAVAHRGPGPGPGRGTGPAAPRPTRPRRRPPGPPRPWRAPRCSCPPATPRRAPPHARYCSILNAHFPLAQSPPAQRHEAHVEAPAGPPPRSAGLHGTRSTRSQGMPGRSTKASAMTTSRASGASARKRAKAGAMALQVPQARARARPPHHELVAGARRRARSARCRRPSTPARRRGRPAANHSARKSLPARTHAARRAMARVARSWPGDRSQMASSTSKRTGRCRSGSRREVAGQHLALEPGHIGAPRPGQRRAAAIATLAPCSATPRSPVPPAVGAPSGRAPTRTWRSAAVGPTPRCRVGAAGRRAAGRGTGSTPPTGPTRPPRPGRRGHGRAAADRGRAGALDSSRWPGEGEPQRRQGVEPGQSVFLVVRRSSGPGPCAAAGSAGSGRAAARPGVRSRSRGAMTAFHSTTVMGVPSMSRRGDSRREKNRRHSYQGTGRHARHGERLPRQAPGELPRDVLGQARHRAASDQSVRARQGIGPVPPPRRRRRPCPGRPRTGHRRSGRAPCRSTPCRCRRARRAAATAVTGPRCRRRSRSPP